MDAKIRLGGNTAICEGVQRLTGAPVMTTDLLRTILTIISLSSRA